MESSWERKAGKGRHGKENRDWVSPFIEALKKRNLSRFLPSQGWAFPHVDHVFAHCDQGSLHPPKPFWFPGGQLVLAFC